MKILSAFVITAFLTFGFLFADSSEIKIGHSQSDVTNLLGAPIGTLILGDKTILMYPQGDVTLRGNKVSTFDLMSDSEFTAEQERKRLEREEWRIQQEKLSAARLKVGKKLKAAKLKSSAFAALSAKQQIDYWRSFQIRYPEVGVNEQITGALEVYQAELKAQMTEKRIAELEARIARAEQAAIKAQNENERLRNQLSTQSYSYNSRYNYSTLPYPIFYPQKKIIINSNKNRVSHHPHRHANDSNNSKYVCSDK